MARPSSKPNILFIMDDQHRGDCTAAAGNRGIRTPNIDRIGAEGVRFRCAYSTSPTCTPARSALLTGMSPLVRVSLHQTPGSARRRLLHHGHRQDALRPAAQSERLSSDSAGRIGAHKQF
ncbi:MAG: sulfatase-like hydrolase/transferase [Bryobacteraceae bacterium]|nr:sulfatase-like hydrolase/transferase [Bryobacteraceae bacterium]